MLFLVHLCATWALVGLIWTVQVVHYPLFDRAERAGFPAFHASHSRRISWIVLPLMLAELATGMALALAPPFAPAAFRLGALALAGIWVSTFALQVPQHRRLARGFQSGAHATLVRTNWIRTALWTTRGGLLLWAALERAAGSG